VGAEMRARLAALILSLSFPALIAGVAHSTTLSDIEKQLMCQCGCTMVLASCQCGMAEEMRAEIQAKLDAGATPQQIIQDFVARYGEAVLSAPTKRGFNLTAWIVPFGAVVGGLAVLYFIVREFAKRGRERALELETGYPEELEAFSEKLDEELKDYL